MYKYVLRVKIIIWLTGTTVSTIVNEICEAVWEELRMIHLSPPKEI